MFRLLLVGQGVKPTGFARVLHRLGRELSSHFEVAHFAINYSGPSMDVGYPIIPNRRRGDVYGRDQLPELIRELKPHGVLFLHDYWFFAIHAPQMVTGFHGVSMIVYCPIEWSPLDATSVRWLGTADCVVSFTSFGASTLRTSFEELGVLSPRIATIHHAIDTEHFYPLGGPGFDGRRSGRQLAREALLKQRPELHGAFIVLNANRNSPRKRLDRTIRTFAEFRSRTKTASALWLHSDPCGIGCEVDRLIANLRIQDDIILTRPTAHHSDSADEYLNLVYNACDVGINTSTSEGWGLVSFEHAATGAPQIMSSHPVSRELWGGTAILFPQPQNNSDPLDEVIDVPVKECVDTLLSFQSNVGIYESSARNCYRLATQPTFSWYRIGNEWKALLLQCFSDVGTV